VRVERVITERHPPPTGRGRPRGNMRLVVDGIIYQLRSGCQWNRLPAFFGSDTTLHRWLTTWAESGTFEAIWAELVKECDELGEVDWKWQSADGSMGKARMGGDGRGPNPTDRAKAGSKKSVLVDERGGPLSLVVDGANIPDCKLLDKTIDSIVVERPKCEQHLCLDAGYDNPSGRAAADAGRYVSHIAPASDKKSAVAVQVAENRAAGS